MTDPVQCVWITPTTGRSCRREGSDVLQGRLRLCAHHLHELYQLIRLEEAEAAANRNSQQETLRKLTYKLKDRKPSIDERAPGVWRVRWRVVVNGQRFQVNRSGFADRSSAHRWWRETKASLLSDHAGHLREMKRELERLATEAQCVYAAAVADLDQQERQAKAHTDRQRKASERAHIVYYVRRPSDGLVKIGTTKNLQQRLSSHRTVDAVELLAAHYGGQPAEAALHRRFKHLRVEREWFRLDDQLQRHIDHVALVRPVMTGESVGNRRRPEGPPSS